ncbi:MAG: 23S rRNA (pseudouridine(1915)-N(3))-methyltransferase RlmH [Chitinispirillaceae bacterium]|nr:23S rRNA (pseudouridine(1915)-N(3))-methyltransferase RlmH [Chitinispirillaceae bacterium]
MLIAVGRVKDRSLLQKIEEYETRIRHDAKLAIVEIKDGTPEQEGKKILAHLQRDRVYGIALDERGTLMSSRDFAMKLFSITQRIVFVLGGPHGLPGSVKQGVRECIALSPMTFTHEMARLLLLEQVYRSISIIKNRKYHKE